jgi:hypothetical protein
LTPALTLLLLLAAFVLTYQPFTGTAAVEAGDATGRVHSEGHEGIVDAKEVALEAGDSKETAVSEHSGGSNLADIRPKVSFGLKKAVKGTGCSLKTKAASVNSTLLSPYVQICCAICAVCTCSATVSVVSALLLL